MALHSYKANRSKTVTAVAGDEDQITFAAGGYEAYEVTNESSTVALFFRCDGLSAVVDGDDSTYVGPGDSVIRAVPTNATRKDLVSVASSGTPKYIVEGLSA